MSEANTAVVAINKSLTLTWSLAAALFFLPLLVPGPQILVGSAVNLFLLLTARNVDRRQMLILALLPSVAAVAHGMLFGPLTPALVFLLPAIWIGNLLLMGVSQSLRHTRLPILVGLIIAAGIKMMWLSVAAYTLYSLHLIPVVLVAAMGVMQFVTAGIGGGLVYVLEKRRLI